jgi:hypothetical protein
MYTILLHKTDCRKCLEPNYLYRRKRNYKVKDWRKYGFNSQKCFGLVGGGGETTSVSPMASR